jgi:putative chitinase
MPDFILTKQQLSQIIAGNPNIDNWYNSLAIYLPSYDINTKLRLSAFLAQCAHETGDFMVVHENLNYTANGLMAMWPKIFPTLDVADQYAHNAEAIANKAYANRLGNGDEASGDGWTFRGRGLIQITGRENYQNFADSIKMNINDVSTYLETSNGAVQSACWYWNLRNLNTLADAGDMQTITLRINGGLISLQDRMTRYNAALQILG